MGGDNEELSREERERILRDLADRINAQYARMLQVSKQYDDYFCETYGIKSIWEDEE